MQTLSRRGRVSDGGQMTFPFLKVTKFPNDVLFFHRISLQLLILMGIFQNCEFIMHSSDLIKFN